MGWSWSPGRLGSAWGALAPKYRRLLGVLAVVVLADRVTKELARAFLSASDGDTAIRVIRGVFYLRWSTNSAGFFGFLEELPPGVRPLFFGLATLAFSSFVLYLIHRASKEARAETEALSLILAGFLGNGFDRVAYGQVIDCAHVIITQETWRASLNLADVAIFVGLVWVFVLHVRGPRAPARAADGDGTSSRASAE